MTQAEAYGLLARGELGEVYMEPAIGSIRVFKLERWKRLDHARRSDPAEDVVPGRSIVHRHVDVKNRVAVVVELNGCVEMQPDLFVAGATENRAPQIM